MNHKIKKTISWSVKMDKNELSTITKPNKVIFTGKVITTNGVHNELL